MSAEHAELVGEMAALEKMGQAERVKHAKKRRAQQLKVYLQYEKRLEKEQNKSSKKKGGKDGKTKSSKLQFDITILLFDAAARNDLEEVETLLNTGIDPNVCNEDGLTLLHQCSLNDLVDMMKLLLRFGANVNACDLDLWTPLHLAASYGNTEICRCLCEHNADLLAVNSDGNMPYDLCDKVETLDFVESEMAKQDVTQELIDETRLCAENTMMSDVVRLANENKDLTGKGRNGETLLHIASCNGYSKVVEFLIDHHVPLDTVDDDGWQAIHCASCWGQVPVVEMLLLHGADAEARTKDGESMLDLCEDEDVKQRIVEIMEEIETKQPMHLKNSAKRQNSSTRRGSNINVHAIRRSSIHEKTSIAHREAQDEAQRLQGLVTMEDDKDDEDDVIPTAVQMPRDSQDVHIHISVDQPKPAENQFKKPLKSIISSKTEEKKVNEVRNSIPSKNDIWMINPIDSTTNAQSSNEKNANSNVSTSQNADKQIKNVVTETQPTVSKTSLTVSENDTQKLPQPAISSQPKVDTQPKNSSSVSSKVVSKELPATSSKSQSSDKPKQTDSKTNANLELGNNGHVKESVKPDASRKPDASGDNKHHALHQGKAGNNNVPHAATSTSSSGANSGNFSPNGQLPPSGTLAELKQQRAKRLQETLKGIANTENGAKPADSANTSVTDENAKNGRANGVVLNVDLYGESPRRYANQQEVVYGDNKCCIIS